MKSKNVRPATSIACQTKSKSLHQEMRTRFSAAPWHFAYTTSSLPENLPSPTALRPFKCSLLIQEGSIRPSFRAALFGTPQLTLGQKSGSLCAAFIYEFAQTYAG